MYFPNINLDRNLMEEEENNDDIEIEQSEEEEKPPVPDDLFDDIEPLFNEFDDPDFSFGDLESATDTRI